MKPNYVYFAANGYVWEWDGSGMPQKVGKPTKAALVNRTPARKRKFKLKGQTHGR